MTKQSVNILRRAWGAISKVKEVLTGTQLAGRNLGELDRDRS
jgi:hypothetical protein